MSKCLQGPLGGALLMLCAGSASAGFGDFVNSITEGVGDAAGSVGKAVGLGDVTDGLDGPFLDEVLAKSSEAAGEAQPATTPEQRQLDIRQMRRADVTLADIRGLEDYANQVMAKIRAAWPDRPIPAQVRLTSSPDFGGQTLQHGTVFVSLGTLLQLDNEDELAALLGHEYSHLILGHHKKDAVDQLKDKAFDYGELLLRMQGGSSGTMTRNYAKLRIARWAASHALMPKWSRGQEAEADILGTDLLIRAGYNTDGMKSMLQKLESTAQQQAEFVAANPITPPDSTSGTGFQFNVGTLLDNISGSLAKELGGDHEDARKRRERVRGYVRDKYPDRPRPEMGFGAYAGKLKSKDTARRLGLYQKAYAAGDLLAAGGEQVAAKDLQQAGKLTLQAIKPETRHDPYLWMLLYDVRYMQHEDQSAQENLGLALDTGQAPYRTYAELASHAFAQRQYAETIGYLDRMQNDLGSDEDMLDTRIAAVRGLNRPTGGLIARCVATGRSSLIERCNQAAGQTGQGGSASDPLNRWGAPAGGFSPRNWLPGN